MLKRLFKNIPAPAAACLALLLTGCGALPITLIGALPMVVSAGGGGVAYTMTNIAYKTFSFPLNDVEGALHGALRKMEIKEVKSEAVEDGVEITAETRKLYIEIWLEEVTASTTRVRVNAKRGAFMKDKATASEIIVQIEKGLDSTLPAKALPGSVPRSQRMDSAISL